MPQVSIVIIKEHIILKIYFAPRLHYGWVVPPLPPSPGAALSLLCVLAGAKVPPASARDRSSLTYGEIKDGCVCTKGLFARNRKDVQIGVVCSGLFIAAEAPIEKEAARMGQPLYHW